MNSKFLGYYKEALRKAEQLVMGVKNTGYNSGGVDIRDYTKYFGMDLQAYDIYKKSLRLISVTSPKNPEAKNLTESAEDTVLDLINYSAFFYAESKCRELEANNNEAKDGTGDRSVCKCNCSCDQCSMAKDAEEV